jgi:hypothetical protein
METGLVRAIHASRYIQTGVAEMRNFTAERRWDDGDEVASLAIP